MSAIAWGIERKVPGPMDTAVDAYEPYLRRLAALGPPVTPSVAPGGPAIRYILGNSVPDNWIPLVPVKTPLRDLVFRRGRMEITASGLTGAHAHGRVLEPWHPLYVLDEAIPRTGVAVTRYVRHARGSDGSTWTWMARRVRPGAGFGSSGLAFDIVEPIQPTVAVGREADSFSHASRAAAAEERFAGIASAPGLAPTRRGRSGGGAPLRCRRRHPSKALFEPRCRRRARLSWRRDV